MVKEGNFSLLILFLGVFGSAVGLAKLKEGGMLERMIAIPTSKRTMMGEYVLANSLIDLLQLSIPTTILVAASSFAPSGVAILLVAFVSAVIASNALGALVAVLAGSSGEVHLVATLSVIFVAASSGLFMPLVGFFSRVSSASPFNLLSSAFQSSQQAQGEMLWPLGFLIAALLLMASMFFSERFFLLK